MTAATDLPTEHLSDVDARAVDALVDLEQTHLDTRFWGDGR
jgi:hypothetical protein